MHKPLHRRPIHKQPITKRISFWVLPLFFGHIFTCLEIYNLSCCLAEEKRFFLYKNDMLWLQAYFHCYMLVCLFIFFGLLGVLFAICSGIVGFLMLGETVNYIEHFTDCYVKK